MMPLLYVLIIIVLVVLSVYMLKNRAKSTNNQSDGSSDTFKNYGTFFAQERWMMEQAEQLKKEREEKKNNNS